MPNNTYQNGIHQHRFGDPVEVTMVFADQADRIGRLIQVRRKCGQFGSDQLFIRKPNGNLQTFENVSLQPYEAAELPPLDGDDTETEYTVAGGKFPETGFIIENPSQPRTHGSFAITVERGSAE